MTNASSLSDLHHFAYLHLLGICLVSRVSSAIQTLEMLLLLTVIWNLHIRNNALKFVVTFQEL